jgi:hypothetical protein
MLPPPASAQIAFALPKKKSNQIRAFEDFGFWHYLTGLSWCAEANGFQHWGQPELVSFSSANPNTIMTLFYAIIPVS